MFDKCICGIMAERLILSGGYSVHLCDACSNEYSEYIRATPEFQEHILNARLLERAMNTQANDLKALGQRDTELFSQLYDLGKKWVEERRAKHE